MRRSLAYGILSFSLVISSVSIFAQSEKLIGRWEGKTSSAQGARDTTANFKKEGEAIAGTITGMRGDIALKDIKIDGNKLTALAEVQTPQGTLTIRYNFTLEGESLNGKGSLDFNGTLFEFDVVLKKAANAAAQSTSQSGASTVPPGGRVNGPGRRGVFVPQPQQKISLDYFVGDWNFDQKGRDSAFGDGLRSGVVSFKKNADGKSVSGLVGGTKEIITISFDENSKAFALTHKYANGVAVNLRGEWTSPIAIRMASDTVKVKGEQLKLRRTLNIVAAHSFTVFDEIAEGEGSFVRLGNAVFSRAETK